MDWSVLGLKHRPFRSTPDSDVWYSATTHEAALAGLLDAIVGEEPFCLLTGPAGIGKTITIHRLTRLLPEGVRTALVTHSRFQSRSDLLQAILFDLGVAWQGMSEQELRLSLIENCLETFADSGRTIVVLDEAQHLNTDLLEELRLLSNVEGRGTRAIQFVLVAQSGIRTRLDKPEMMSLRQRIAHRAELMPLDKEESADFLLHQLRLAGGIPGRILADEPLELLAESCQGSPRLLNQAATMAMNLAQADGGESIDVESVLESLSRLGLIETGAEDEEEAAEAEPATRFTIHEAPSAPNPTPVEVRPAVRATPAVVKTNPEMAAIPWLPSTAVPEESNVLVYGEDKETRWSGTTRAAG